MKHTSVRRAEPRLLLCYAHGRPDDWEAICLDLDIAVQGRSFGEVEGLLELAVANYFASAVQEPPEVAAKLLLRSAPLHIRLRYILSFFWHSVRGRWPADGTVEYSYQMPCPA